MESLSRGVLSSLTALHVLTSQNIPKKAYLEDLIDRIVIFTKFQLQNTIYPTFDPVYRIDPKGRGKYFIYISSSIFECLTYIYDSICFLRWFWLK